MKWQVYSHYLKSIGWFLSVSTILMNAVFQMFSISANVWLSVWSSDNSTMHIVNKTLDNGTNSLVNETDQALQEFYLEIYGALGIGQGT